MTRIQKRLVGAAALAFSMAVVGNASAITPEKKGTFKLAAERMLGFGVNINNGNAEFGMTVLPAPNPLALQFPRIGADYFIIDGLSIGGNLGMTYWSGAGGQVGYLVLPRVGYEFELARDFDFWPRGGIGVIGTDPGGASPILAIEAMFLWEFFPHVGVEFGPTFDAAFEYDIFDLAANAGLFVSF